MMWLCQAFVRMGRNLKNHGQVANHEVELSDYKAALIEEVIHFLLNIQLFL